MWRAAFAASVALIGIGAVCAQPKASGINWSPRGINAHSVFGRANNRIQDRRLLNLLAETEFVLNAGNNIRVGLLTAVSFALPECLTVLMIVSPGKSGLPWPWLGARVKSNTY